MARLSKEEQARRDAMDYAYRLVMERGIKALEERTDRNRKTFAPAFLSDAKLHEFEHYVKQNCIISFTCMMAMVLRDKYGFGKKRMAEYAVYFHDMCDSISENWLTYNDIITTIREETGVDLVPFKQSASTILEEQEKRFADSEKKRSKSGGD